ncbi:oxygenase MpaB family protein, partial [Roseomonas acroporae]|uniref:oxygenase MpaB family protein n=1 Tax=Roseomonas acroporae TaxID=2937791 RepID=UPI0024A69C90
RVRAIHARVHVTEATSFLDAWIRYAEPSMAAADQDRYFAEMAVIGAALGADPVPCSRVEARRLMQGIRPALRRDARTEAVARLILRRPAASPAVEPVRALMSRAAVDLLPEWARRLHGLPAPGLDLPLVQAGMFGVAGTLRWAFGQGSGEERWHREA